MLNERDTIASALLRGGCELRGCERTRALVPEARPATDDDWGHEFLDRILAVKVVDTVYNAAGATAVYESHLIQRYFQDIHVISQHMQARMAVYELVGRYWLGLPIDDQRL